MAEGAAEVLRRIRRERVERARQAGGRRWTEDEDGAIRDAAALNRAAGIGIGGRGKLGRLRAVADAIGRSHGAVRRRAVRIGASSR